MTSTSTRISTQGKKIFAALAPLPQRGLLSIAVFFLLVCLSGSLASAHLPGPPQKSKTVRVVANAPAPAFTLVDQNGSTFDSESLRGRVVLVTFTFTTCPDVCPLLTAKFAHLQRLLARENGKVFLVSITTDPEVDKPAVLKAYAQRYGADFATWAFLTGAEEKIKDVWQAFGVNVSKKARGLVQHTSLTTLIDSRGVRRVNYYGDLWEEKEVLSDVQSLLREKEPAAGRKR